MIREIFDQIPSQLDSQSKRFTFASVAPRGTFERYRNHVLWLVDAGAGMPPPVPGLVQAVGLVPPGLRPPPVTELLQPFLH